VSDVAPSEDLLLKHSKSLRERYRDLLQAADTIAAMQTSAGTLMEQVRHVQANCRSLNEQQLLGFQSTANASAKDAALKERNAGKKLQTYYGTMAQIKLLTALPELIWTHLDNDRFYAASELFIFSRHISTGLQLDGQSALMQKLPVARKQWEILRPFHVTIKQAILTALEREELLPEMAVDCLQSLLLLDKSDLSTVLKSFLNLRSSAFLNCLQSGPSEPRRVKDRILASLNVLNSTVELLDKCLLGMFPFADRHTTLLLEQSVFSLVQVIAFFLAAWRSVPLLRVHPASTEWRVASASWFIFYPKSSLVLSHNLMYLS